MIIDLKKNLNKLNKPDNDHNSVNLQNKLNYNFNTQLNNQNNFNSTSINNNNNFKSNSNFDFSNINNNDNNINSFETNYKNRKSCLTNSNNCEENTKILVDNIPYDKTEIYNRPAIDLSFYKKNENALISFNGNIPLFSSIPIDNMIFIENQSFKINKDYMSKIVEIESVFNVEDINISVNFTNIPLNEDYNSVFFNSSEANNIIKNYLPNYCYKELNIIISNIKVTKYNNSFFDISFLLEGLLESFSLYNIVYMFKSFIENNEDNVNNLKLSLNNNIYLKKNVDNIDIDYILNENNKDYFDFDDFCKEIKNNDLLKDKKEIQNSKDKKFNNNYLKISFNPQHNNKYCISNNLNFLNKNNFNTIASFSIDINRKGNNNIIIDYLYKYINIFESHFNSFNRNIEIKYKNENEFNNNFNNELYYNNNYDILNQKFFDNIITNYINYISENLNKLNCNNSDSKHIEAMYYSLYNHLQTLKLFKILFLIPESNLENINTKASFNLINKKHQHIRICELINWLKESCYKRYNKSNLNFNNIYNNISLLIITGQIDKAIELCINNNLFDMLNLLTSNGECSIEINQLLKEYKNMFYKETFNNIKEDVKFIYDLVIEKHIDTNYCKTNYSYFCWEENLLLNLLYNNEHNYNNNDILNNKYMINQLAFKNTITYEFNNPNFILDINLSIVYGYYSSVFGVENKKNGIIELNKSYYNISDMNLLNPVSNYVIYSILSRIQNELADNNNYLNISIEK